MRPISRVPIRGVITTTGGFGIIGRVSEKPNVYIDFFMEHAAGHVRAQGVRFRPVADVRFVRDGLLVKQSGRIDSRGRTADESYATETFAWRP